MLKAIERMHVRSKIVQIGATCMGQLLTACYRTLKNEETGLSFCMMMRWSGHDTGKVNFNVQETDELMHLWFEDHGCDWERENYLKAHGDIQLAQEVLDSAVYQRVYQQLLRAMKKKLAEEDLTVDDALNIIKK